MPSHVSRKSKPLSGSWVVGQGGAGGCWGVNGGQLGAKVDRAARALPGRAGARRAAAAHGSFVGKLVCKGVDELKSGQ